MMRLSVALPRRRAVAVAAMCGVTTILFVLCAGFSAGSAFGASAWWHLSSTTRPTRIHPGLATDEIQKVTVSATGGEFALANMSEEEVKREEFFDSEGNAKFVSFPVGAEAGAVQTGLETLYGAGNLEVAGGPGDAAGSKPYIVTFKGAFTDQPVRVLNTQLGTMFFGLEGSEVASETAAGKADGEIVATAENLGDSSVNGKTTAVQIADTLPPGVTPIAIAGSRPDPVSVNSRVPLACSLETRSCMLKGELAPYEQVEVRIPVEVEAGISSASANEVRVSGGETPSANIKRALEFSSEDTPFGVDEYSLTPENEGGSPDSQSGSHPFQLTTTVALNQGRETASLGEPPSVNPPELPKDLNFRWPAGLIGNPSATAQCGLGRFLELVNGLEDECPSQTAVGVVNVTVNEPLLLKVVTFTVPLFNLEPAEGEPARFGFVVPAANVPVVIDTSLRTGGDYGVNVTVHNASQTAALLNSQVTVWGVPGDPRHDGARGWGCLYAARGVPFHRPCNALEDQHPAPFLSLPTACTGDLSTSVEGDSWTHVGAFQTWNAVQPIPGVLGCNQLPFDASIQVTPESHSASTATGLNVDVHVPLDANKNPNGLDSSAVKDIKVALPSGLTLNPSGADGLAACQESEVGFLPEASGPAALHFTSGLPAPVGAPSQPFCPDAAKVGTVTIKTPLLPDPLQGSVYLASQNANPFGSLVAVYLVARDPVSGSLVKLAGNVTLDQATGQITTDFEGSPQLPFEDAELHFFGGERAALATPDHCGVATTEAQFSPWSGNRPVVSHSSFDISAGPNQSACPGSLPFAPTLAAGTTNAQAGAFTVLRTTIARQDGNQPLQTVQINTPPGLSGILTGVKLCGEAQANAGSCGAESLIGHASVKAGVGGHPYDVGGGRVYLTEGYGGAPFGLSIVTPAIAGPFDLGLVVVRAKVAVDPHTAALTVTTGNIPHILDGIPLAIRQVDVAIDRSGFAFNPTSCMPLAIGGVMGSVEGAIASAASPFHAVNCATLGFAPRFSVSTTGKTSKLRGASLVTKLVYPHGSLGTQANIARVKVVLPKQLPSRLTTLQQACLAATFEADRAHCPAGSVVGHAKVTTPVLPVPLTGQAYFVSHGGEAFPSLTIVLKGYGVTVELVGSTLIRKGITSTTFGSVPDVPFSTFELTLPQGRFSALAAFGNLCKAKLAMPTAFIAQNGAEIHQTTKIGVTGCPKAHRHSGSSHRSVSRKRR